MSHNSICLMGKKMGMTRLFLDSGESIGVSVVQILSNNIVQLKTLEKDCYQAVQATVGLAKKNKINKPQLNHFLKSYDKQKIDPENQIIGEKLFEFKVNDLSAFKVGDILDVSHLSEVKYVDISSTSIGKGFQGGIKRHNFSAQDASHGNSLAHRLNGSIGQNQSPGRVFKGKKMSGHMGAKKTTNTNLKVIKIDREKGLLLVHGSIAGYTGCDVLVRPSIKKENH